LLAALAAGPPDVLDAALQEADPAALCQLKAVSVTWRTSARRELFNRLCCREGQPKPTGFANITDLDAECLQDAGRPWEVAVAGRQLPQLARLHGFGFVVDVRQVRQVDWGAEERFSTILRTTLRSCIQGEGDPPYELLLAAVACAASGTVHRVPVQRLREDDAIGELDLHRSALACIRNVGNISAGLLGLMLPAATSVSSLRWCVPERVQPTFPHAPRLRIRAVAPAFLSAPIETPLSQLPALSLARSLDQNGIGDKGLTALAAILKKTKITRLRCTATTHKRLLSCQCR